MNFKELFYIIVFQALKKVNNFHYIIEGNFYFTIRKKSNNLIKF